MTTIVGLQGDGYCLIAGDTRIASIDSDGVPYQINTLKAETSKIAVNGKYLIGTAGDLRAINLLTHTLTPPICPPNLKGKKLDEFVTNKLIPAIRQMFEQNGYTTNEQNTNTNKAEHGSELLVAINQTIYLIDGDYSWFTDASGIYAIGTGAPYALGALHNMPPVKNPAQAKKHAIKALATASRYDPNTGSPYHTHIQQTQQKTDKPK
jgi:ATP-dependent protease HslVU (ClpYQ) peptidase subunit